MPNKPAQEGVSLKDIYNAVIGLSKDVSTLKSDVSTLKTDVSTLKKDMIEVKAYIANKSSAQEATLTAQLMSVMSQNKILQIPVRLSWSDVRRMDGTELTDLDGALIIPDMRNTRPGNGVANFYNKRSKSGHLVVLEAKNSMTKTHVENKMSQIIEIWNTILNRVYGMKHADLQNLTYIEKERVKNVHQKWIGMVEDNNLNNIKFNNFITLVFGYGLADPLVLEYIELINHGITKEQYHNLSVRFVRSCKAYSELSSVKKLGRTSRDTVELLTGPNISFDTLRQGLTELMADSIVNKLAKQLLAFMTPYEELAPSFRMFRDHMGQLHESGKYSGPLVF